MLYNYDIIRLLAAGRYGQLLAAFVIFLVDSSHVTVQCDECNRCELQMHSHHFRVVPLAIEVICDPKH